MADFGKGKEKENVSEMTRSNADPLTSQSKGGEIGQEFIVVGTAPSPIEVSAAPTTSAGASALHEALPSETTEGPSMTAHQINPYISVVSLPKMSLVSQVRPAFRRRLGTP